MEHIWHYGGVDYYFDISEKSCTEKITRALSDLREEMSRIECESDSAGVDLERHCGMIASFFDTVLGRGAGERVCGSVGSAKEHSAAYVDFILFVKREVDALARIRETLENEYGKVAPEDRSS